MKRVYAKISVSECRTGDTVVSQFYGNPEWDNDNVLLIKDGDVAHYDFALRIQNGFHEFQVWDFAQSEWITVCRLSSGEMRGMTLALAAYLGVEMVNRKRPRKPKAR